MKIEAMYGAHTHTHTLLTPSKHFLILIVVFLKPSYFLCQLEIVNEIDGWMHRVKSEPE